MSKSLINIRLKDESVMRKRRRWKKIVRAKNIERNNLPKPRSRKKEKRQYDNFGWQVTTMPENFTMGNLEGVLGYINDTYKLSKVSGVNKIWMGMLGVTNIDIYCICLLLAQINKLGSRKVSCYGNYPTDDEKRQFVIESGFLKICKSNVKESADVKYDNNQMYMVGKDAVESDRICKSVKSCMKQLIGREENYNPVYENMVEICANSVEHANKQNVDKNWLVSISQQEDGSMKFILTDTGEGLLNTLLKKKSDMFKDKLRGRRDHDVLKRVFQGEYLSRSGELNRHKGLPEVYENYTDGFISHLQVLTNGVFFDFDTNDHIELDNEFMGVMISWTLSINNYNRWIQSLSEY